MLKRFRNQRGAALLETAITIPLILLVSVSIFEFGRAYQTWQVLTNAAREGARVAVLPGYTNAQVQTAVTTYLNNGRLSNPNTATITINRAVPFGATDTASQVTVNYPFNFVVLGPVAKLVKRGSTMGAPLTMQSSALMRNE